MGIRLNLWWISLLGNHFIFSDVILSKTTELGSKTFKDTKIVYSLHTIFVFRVGKIIKLLMWKHTLSNRIIQSTSETQSQPKQSKAFA